MISLALDQGPPAKQGWYQVRGGLWRNRRTGEVWRGFRQNGKARNANPVHPQPHAWLASAYALKGQTERAAAELAEARRLNSDDRYSSIARLKAAQFWGVPKVRTLFEATYFAGLRKAGVPEE